MYDMKKLAALVKELEDQLMVCMRCGMCQAVCPVFAETGREADVARGKLALLDGLIQANVQRPEGRKRAHDALSALRLMCGQLPQRRESARYFSQGARHPGRLHGAAPGQKDHFPRHARPPEAFQQPREIGEQAPGDFRKTRRRPSGHILRTLFLSRWQIGTSRLLRPFPSTRSVGRLDTNAASGLKVGFFVGCMIDKIYPNIGHAVLSALKHNGVGVLVPDEQGCCGIPALSSGDLKSFQKLVRYNLDRFPPGDFDCLVTACATCTSTIKKLWPMFADDLSEAERSRMNELAEKTMDISQFLVEKTGVVTAASSSEGEKALLSYHDPCHLKKSLGIAAQPRAILRANSRYVFKEMNEADRCCGCGGSFNLQYYGISASIGKRKRDSIVESGCSTVATSCPACMLQISDMLSQAGERIQVKHAVEIYADSLE